MSDPIRLITRAKNNRLMEIRESMQMSARKFADFLGISYTYYLEIESLKHYPSHRSLEKMIDKLGSVAEELFPEYLKKVTKNISVTTVPEETVLSLTDPEVLAISESNVDQMNNEEWMENVQRGLSTALVNLRPREEQVIRLRFGLDDTGEEKTLQTIAEELGLSKERIRQIQAKALRKLRHPSSRLRSVMR